MKPRRRGAVDVGQRTVGDSMRYAVSGSRLLTRVWIFGPYFQGSTRLDYLSISIPFPSAATAVAFLSLLSSLIF
jgi:hypothetical protein